jgi:hypothetical protein
MPTDYADEEAIRAHQEFAEFAAAWLRQNPSSRAARLLVPAVKADLAFVQRGSGYAHEVPPGAWKEIARIVKEATKELDAMAPEEKRDPIWHLIRLNLLLVEPRDPPAMEKMIAAAIDSAPEMPQVYFRASDLYDPSYGGSYRQIALFAERTLKRPSKEGSHALYARIQWSNKSKDMFTNGQADWSLMRKGFEQIVERYPHSWNINSFGWFACLAKDKEATLRLTDLSLNPPNSLMEKAWGSNIFFFRCRSWAADAGPWYAP